MVLLRLNDYLIILHEDLIRKIIGCAMEVQKRLDNGFLEVIYQRALTVEMRLAGLEFKREMEMPVYYRDELIGKRSVDFFVEEKIMVELKAIKLLEDINISKALNYLEAFKKEIGLLLNFGAKSLEYKRVHNNKLLKP